MSKSRAVAVTESERYVVSKGEHVRTSSVVVRNDGDGSLWLKVAETVGSSKVAVGDNEECSSVAKFLSSNSEGVIEAEGLSKPDGCASRESPLCDHGILAHHDTRSRSAGANDTLGEAHHESLRMWNALGAQSILGEWE